MVPIIQGPLDLNPKENQSKSKTSTNINSGTNLEATETLESFSDINVVDSMIGASRQLSTSVEMQFSQLYGRQKLNASLLKVQQHKNLVDCGVFAIAFCTEYCYTGRKGVLLAEFDIMRMRDHLHNCIENMELTPFPKLRRKLKLLKQTEKVLNYSIAADCAALCEFPNSYDDMVQCDTKTCQNWFHYKCAGLNSPTYSLLLDL